jgi:manganese/zinc/iron transport system substrate-binding protein
VLDTVKLEYQFNVRLVAGDDALYSDALGEPGSAAENYLGMILHNARVIRRNLARE